MTKPWLRPLAQAVNARTTIADAVGVIETPRVRLRAPLIEDWPVLEPIWTTERAKFIGGPFQPETAYLDFCQAVAGWVLRGVGGFTIEDRQTGQVLGLAGLFVDWGDPEPELGWLLTEAAEGKGIAMEAAIAIRDHLFGSLGFDQVVSYIDAPNTRSTALAERMGATRDPEPLPDTGGDVVLVYRHKRDLDDKGDT
jgi:RimJ/RimL family protein N-acetyltransferase